MVDTGHKTKRPERPHHGAMIWARVPLRQAEKIADIAKRSGRKKSDILRLAVGHLKAFPDLYKNLDPGRSAGRPIFVCFRVSKELRLQLSDYAWAERFSRSTWISAAIANLFRLVSKGKIIRFLSTGRDLKSQIEENIREDTADSVDTGTNRHRQQAPASH